MKIKRIGTALLAGLMLLNCMPLAAASEGERDIPAITATDAAAPAHEADAVTNPDAVSTENAETLPPAVSKGTENIEFAAPKEEECATPTTPEDAENLPAEEEDAQDSLAPLLEPNTHALAFENMPSRTEMSLNGPWLFSWNGTDYSDAPGAVDYDAADWETVQVPHSWNDIDGTDALSGYRRGEGWYRKTITLTQEQLTGRRVYFDCKAVS